MRLLNVSVKNDQFLDFHKDDTRKTVLEHDFHNNRQSRLQDCTKILHIAYLTKQKSMICSLLRQ